MAWCRFKRFDRAARSSSFHSASGSRTDLTVDVRRVPLTGRPRRISTASVASCGISQSANREGPPGSPAPANAFRRTGRNRAKSTGKSRGSVVLVVRFFMAGGPTRADDAHDIPPNLGVHDVEETLLA